MLKARILLIFSIWIAILPYLGFPSVWKNILFTLTGLGLALFSYMLHREFRVVKKKKPVETFDNFSENKDFVPETSASEESV